MPEGQPPLTQPDGLFKGGHPQGGYTFKILKFLAKFDSKKLQLKINADR
jgi:hypothetical protein